MNDFYKSCVKITSPRFGTGFFISPNLIITCAHVVKDLESHEQSVIYIDSDKREHRANLLTYNYNQEYRAEAVLLANVPSDNYLEISFDKPKCGAQYIIVGYPEYEGFNKIDPCEESTATYEGFSGEGKDREHYLLKDTRVRPGYSGAPIICRRSKRVFGIIRTRISDNCTAWGVPISCLVHLKHGEISKYLDNHLIRMSNQLSNSIENKFFAHFLDHHFLDLNVSLQPRNKESIFLEAKTAFHIALCLFDVVVVPAVSYAQSKFCRDLLDALNTVFDLGAVALVGDESDWQSFLQVRLSEYQKGQTEYELYSHLIKNYNPIPPYHATGVNTTLDLITSWQDELILDTKKFMISAPELENIRQPDFKKSLFAIGDRLQGQAFIARNVQPILFKDINLETSLKLTDDICRKFFDTFIARTQSHVFSSFNYLKNGNPSPTKETIDYGRISRFIFSSKNPHIWEMIRNGETYNVLRSRNDELHQLLRKQLMQENMIPLAYGGF